MRSESYILINENVRNNAIMRINDLECKGQVKITISSSGDKSARQRGLQWLWYTDVALAGIGGEHEDTKDGVHLVSKYRWAIPILVRDDDHFTEIYSMWVKMHGSDPERMEYFVKEHVHTEKFTVSQMAEYLTDFQKHYGQTVNLSDPQDKKLLEWKKGG